MRLRVARFLLWILRKILPRKYYASIEISQQSEYPVYELGNPDPCFFIPQSIDMQISLHDKIRNCVQAIDIDMNTQEGKLTLVGTPGSIWNKEIIDLKGQVCRLIVKTIGPNGEVEEAFNEAVMVLKPLWTGSIDDIVTETRIPFRILV